MHLFTSGQKVIFARPPVRIICLLGRMQKLPSCESADSALWNEAFWFDGQKYSFLFLYITHRLEDYSKESVFFGIGFPRVFGFCRGWEAYSPLDKITLEVTPHTAGGDPYCRVAANPFDLARITLGVKVKFTINFNEPNRCSYAFTILSKSFQTQVLVTFKLFHTLHLNLRLYELHFARIPWMKPLFASVYAMRSFWYFSASLFLSAAY